MKVVVVLSGGMDSTTLLYDVINQGYDVSAISFNYGQKHKKELLVAAQTCTNLNIPHKVIDLSVLNELAPSALTRDDIDVPEGSYEDESMKLTVVPNRNLTMGNLALAYALTIKASKIFLGTHGGDHFIYEDCREQAVNSLNENAYVWDSDNRGSLTPTWIRAFFEAEGCFTSGNYKQIQYNRSTGKRIGICKPTKVPYVIISQKDKNLLEEIKKFFYGRGTIYMNKKGCGDYKLQHQDCRLMIDLMKDNFKTKHKKEQFDKWYIKFKDMFERKVNQSNPSVRGKTYQIQKIKFETPYLFLDKGDIAIKGKELNVDYSLTWTCYKGKSRACGKCGACVERLEAFKKAKMEDPVEYD